LALIYGPESRSAWGSRLARVQATSSDATAGADAPSAGTYLVLVAESARRSYAFQLSLHVAANGCVAASGACQALGPSGCPSGMHPGDTTEYSCGGGLGIMCCLPGGANACVQAGGDCVPLTPGSCNPIVQRVGDATNYSCGGGLGVECCLPICKPYCGAIGSKSEGWYDGCTGALIGWASCSGHAAACAHGGTASEGWYDGSKLIRTADCQ
jgi:hypothetical protein